MPWHIIPIIALSVSGPKTFPTIFACWLVTCPIPDRIRNYITNFDLLRKSAIEADEDRSILRSNNLHERNTTFDHDNHCLDSILTSDQTPLMTVNNDRPQTNVILALDLITSTNLQYNSIDLVPISSGHKDLAELITSYLSDTVGSSAPESQHSINTLSFNQDRFVSFENTYLTEWKSSLKNQ